MGSGQEHAGGGRFRRCKGRVCVRNFNKVCMLVLCEICHCHQDHAVVRTLVVTYTDTIKKGAVLCLENVVTTLAQCENSVAVQKAADHYSEQMAQRVRFPTDTLQELLDVHADCEREAIAVFMEHSFKDDKREFQKTCGALS
ncbi:guanylate-binding protein 3-like [Crocuta crocuta]